MLHRRDLDSIATPQRLGQCRLELGQAAVDQRRDRPREPAGLLLYIKDPQRALTLRLMCQPLAEPSVDRLDTLERVARGGVSAVEPIKNIKLVGRPLRSGDRIDGR